MSDPIAEMYNHGCENRAQMELVFSDDAVLKGTIGMVLLKRC